MTKIAITGATGLLGRAFMREFNKADNFQVTGLGFSRTGENIVKLDLTDPAALEDFFSASKPEVIIHSAAHRRPDICQNDPQATQDLNVISTRNIATAAKNIGAAMIYISTDYVFDGTNPPYQPDDATNPLNTYGQSKLDGEKVVAEVLPDGGISLRVPILYGQCETLSESAVTIIAEEMLAQLDTDKQLTHDDWAIRFPTFVDDVAKCCRELAEYKLSNPEFSGICHFSGNEPMTKYTMAVEIAKIIGFDQSRLIGDSNLPTGAPRPQNAQLDCGRLTKLGVGLTHTPFAQGVAQAIEPFLKQ